MHVGSHFNPHIRNDTYNIINKWAVKFYEKLNKMKMAKILCVPCVCQYILHNMYYIYRNLQIIVSLFSFFNSFKFIYGTGCDWVRV